MGFFVISCLIDVIINIAFVQLRWIIQLLLGCNLSQLIRPWIHRYKDILIPHCLKEYLNICLNQI